MIVNTPEQLAYMLHVTPQAVTYWESRPGFPGHRGYYPVDEIATWRDENRSRGAGRPAKTPQAPGQSEDRLRTAKAEIAELHLRERRGELVHKDEIIADLARKTARVNAVDSAFPDRLASRLAEMRFEADIVLEARQLAQDMIAETQRLRSQAILGEEDDEDISMEDEEDGLGSGTAAGETER